MPHDAFAAASAAREGAARPIRITSVDHDAIIDLLTQAFADDPSMAWSFRADERRMEAYRSFMDFAVRQQCAPFNRIFASPDLKAIAVWLPPEGLGALDLGAGQILRLLPRLIAMSGWSRLRRPLALAGAMDKHHPKTPPHWYLYFIGVHPDLKGRGVGSAMLAATLAEIDAERMPAYLDNTNPKNTRLYERHGFRVVSEYRATPDAPPLWGMWREARA